MKTFLSIILVALLILCGRAPLRAQDLDPGPSTPAQDSLLTAGMALHDKGDYDGAIAAYATILKENPANVMAIAEMSMTYFAKQDFANTIKYAQEGLKYRWKYRAHLYLNLGNAYDMLGKSEEAIAAYRKGLEAKPADYLLHYNLGLAYDRNSDFLGAREHYHAALKARPTHASSHLALGHLYRKMNKRIPAIFAYARFLELEPNSSRSADAALFLRSLLSDSLSTRVTGTHERTISVTPDSDEVDGDLTVLALTLAMTQTVRVAKDTVYSSPLDAIRSDLTNFFEITLELMDKDHGPGFCWEYYAPYFAAIQEKGYTDTFVRLIFGAGTDRQKEKEFKEWSAAYKWL